MTHDVKVSCCEPYSSDDSDQSQKRACSLPFRISPTSKHLRLFSQSSRKRPSTLFTQPLTPADSSEEEISPASSTAHKPYLHELSQMNMNAASRPNDFDSDMEMAESAHVNSSPRPWEQDTSMLSPKASPCTVLPLQATPTADQDSSNAGRLPTPIYGHFQHSSQAQMVVTSAAAESPSQSQQDIDYKLHLRRRRLPTPISEDEEMDSFATTTPRMEDGAGNLETHGLREPVRFPPPLPSQPRKRGKIMFSMGFRADCEMCRNRVSGHCNHIFRV